MRRVLFVCTGNICRSPTADGVARQMIVRLGLEREIAVDSAGTTGYHAGERPDPRACAAAQKRGYDLRKLRARRLEDRDFERFDLLLAMDEEHLAIMQRKCPPEHRHKVQRFMDFARRFDAREVPDPYYGGERGFDVVLDMVEDAVGGLIERLGGR
ncbi:MAG: low molecular weight phosphotyrosine protein phosphatase [Rhodocyclaceae bacterium]|nr:low molecular weight phosphotyrosine protein phosphatase [Rhodocyclaceae bacterium]